MNKVLNLYATPIYEGQVNSFLFNDIQKEFQKTFDDLKSNNKFACPDGWGDSQLLSDTTFTRNLIADYNLELFNQELELHIKSYLQAIGSDVGTSRSPEYKIVSWMTLNGNRSYAHTHNHYDADISGCYYFKTTGEDGSIFFTTPNKVLSTSYCFRHYHTRATFKPSPGMILLFPGWLEHGVQTNNTDNERISIAFNIYFKRY